MTSRIRPCTLRIENCYILYDANAVNAPSADFFDPEAWEKRGRVAGRAQGRGETWFLRGDEGEWVLRHYRRGGLVARLLSDQYLGWLPERSRAFREWRLLAKLRERGLPVPRPVAACVERRFPFYRADLVTERIPDVRSLAQALNGEALSGDLWRRIGECVRRFHDAGCWHADLNAHNILIDSRDEIFLIDFDRGRLRSSGSWTRGNLERLHRSLRKLRGLCDSFRFSPEDWRRLLEGYGG